MHRSVAEVVYCTNRLSKTGVSAETGNIPLTDPEVDESSCVMSETLNNVRFALSSARQDASDARSPHSVKRSGMAELGKTALDWKLVAAGRNWILAPTSSMSLIFSLSSRSSHVA